MHAQLKCLNEGPHHIVVFKAANMVTTPARGSNSLTLLDLVQQQFGKNMRAVHRLDRGTAGVCLFAKTSFGEQALLNAFKRHLIDKRYIAVVEGRPDFNKRVVDARLQRIDSPQNKKGPQASQLINDEGQRAVTSLKVLARGEKVSVIEARPQTGRMHQIRAHLAHIGHPIVGDKHYGSTLKFEANVFMLLAYYINFPLPNGGRETVQISLPANYQAFLLGYGIEL